MENAEALTQLQIQGFLKGNEGGKPRQERYRWVQRVLVAQEYAVQGRKRRLSLPQVTRLIRQYRAGGVAIAAAYRRRFP